MNARTPASKIAALKELRILYVEDEPLTRAQVESLLAAEAGEFITATDGNTGLLAFAKHSPDIVVADLTMPGIDGIEMIVAMRSMKPDVPVIITTANEDVDELVRAVEIGVDRYVLKPVDPDKLLLALQTTATRLQRLRESTAQRELTATTLDSLPNPALLVDFGENGSILIANKPAMELGYHQGGQLSGDFFRNLDPNAPTCPWKGFEKYRGRKYPDLISHNRVWDLTVSPVSGNLYLLHAEDVTERKQMERLREDVERIVRHDLKSPLSSIIGFSELIMLDPTAAETEHYAKIINDAGTSMLDRINNSLDLYKMERGAYKPADKPFDLRRLLDDLRNEFASLSAAMHCELNITLNNQPLDRAAPAQVRGEQRLLAGMCANLVKNALEASPLHGVITVQAGTAYGLDFTVHNQGAVPLDMRNRFFEMYATSGKVSGTGLGTYSALLIAKAYHGNITFTTSEEEGTTVLVNLPPL